MDKKYVSDKIVIQNVRTWHGDWLT